MLWSRSNTQLSKNCHSFHIAAIWKFGEKLFPSKSQMILQITIFKYSICMRMYLNMMRNFKISLFSGCIVGMSGFIFGIVGEPQDWGLRLKLYYIYNELIYYFSFHNVVGFLWSWAGLLPAVLRPKCSG